MNIWAIADLHLSFGVLGKGMEHFGPSWDRHAERIEEHWRASISADDLVLIPGDISWALKLEEALPDLRWIDALPGTKVMLKGNHDYWWGSLNKILAVLPPSIHLIQNNAFHWNGVAIGGARLWDTPEYSFGEWIEYRENTRERKPKEVEVETQEDLAEKQFVRELQRLELSLSQMNPEANVRIAMTHYPPIGPRLEVSRASQILEKHRIQCCVFGHLHNVRERGPLLGEARGVRYLFAAADYIQFRPVRVVEL